MSPSPDGLIVGAGLAGLSYALEPPWTPVRIRPGVYTCGDHRDNASINGALASERRAGEVVLSDLQR